MGSCPHKPKEVTFYKYRNDSSMWRRQRKTFFTVCRTDWALLDCAGPLKMDNEYNRQTQTLLWMPTNACWEEPDIAVSWEGLLVPDKYRSGCSQPTIETEHYVVITVVGELNSLSVYHHKQEWLQILTSSCAMTSVVTGKWGLEVWTRPECALFIFLLWLLRQGAPQKLSSWAVIYILPPFPPDLVSWIWTFLLDFPGLRCSFS
jgi:hypothetical protein